MAATVFYDEDCGVCRFTADKLVRYGRPAVRALPIQGDEAQRALETAGVPASKRLTSFHVRDANGNIRSAGAAVAPLARSLPFGGAFAVLAELSPPMTERAYQWSARHRTQLGRLLGQQACAVDPSRARPRPPRPATEHAS